MKMAVLSGGWVRYYCYKRIVGRSRVNIANLFFSNFSKICACNF